MKRKDYKEVSPEPKDYRGSDYSAHGQPLEGKCRCFRAATYQGEYPR
jgi:hypothetical protein